MISEMKWGLIVIFLYGVVACTSEHTETVKPDTTSSQKVSDSQDGSLFVSNVNPGKPSLGKDKAPESTISRWRHAGLDDADLWETKTREAILKYGHYLLEVIPVDILDFCPAYAGFSFEKKTQFWIFMLSAISEFESGHRPELEYRERFRNKFGEHVRSRGLLQLSRESVIGYGCEFSSECDLHDPVMNLECGVIILNRWIGKDRRITGRYNRGWRGGARYWSILRDDSKLRQIKIWTQESGFCR